jgi:sodium transport system permease protein
VIHDVWTLYRRELRSALRERTVVVNGILIPIFLYPVLLWALFSALLFVEGLAEGFDSRVAWPDSTAAPDVAAALAAHERLEVIFVGDPAEARSRLEAGLLDAVILIDAATAGDAATAAGDAAGLREGAGNIATPSDPPALRVLYDRAEERSRRALSRIESATDSLRTVRLTAEARARGLDTAMLRAFRVEWDNVSSSRDTGRMFLALLVPVFLTIMVALGCFIPAVDTTAGERERSTWETLWTTGPSRGSVILSKYLFVATMGTVAGVLNVVAISASLGGVLRPLMGDRMEAVSFALPAAAVPLMLAGAVLLALLFAAAMMVLAVFARTFKEGQAMVTPAYWLALAPLILGGSPDRTLTPALALVPVANVALAARDAIQARVDGGLVVLAFGVNLVLVLVCLALARSLAEREEVVTGEFEGSLWSWLRARRRAARGSA